MNSQNNNIIPDELLAILACPKCKGDLILDKKLGGLICNKCALFYEIREGIPIMLIDEAKPLEEVKQEQRNE